MRTRMLAGCLAAGIMLAGALSYAEQAPAAHDGGIFLTDPVFLKQTVTRP